MKDWTIIFNLLPLITQLIKIAEALFGDNTGKTKKAYVKEGIRTALDGVEMVSTGGQKETLGLVKKNFSLFDGLIDLFCGALFPSETVESEPERYGFDDQAH